MRHPIIQLTPNYMGCLIEFYTKESFLNTILNENEFQNPQIFQQTHIMLRDLLTQKCVQKNLVTDFGYPRACRFRKHQF
jgi:hypothetical protein